MSKYMFFQDNYPRSMAAVRTMNAAGAIVDVADADPAFDFLADRAAEMLVG